MLQRFFGATIIDPAHPQRDGSGEIWVRDGVIVERSPHDHADESIDLTGLVVMAGGIDLHTHIGGGKLTIARSLLPERYRDQQQAQAEIAAKADPVSQLRQSVSGYAPGSFATGYAYARMGYTACFEPAMLLGGARQAHLEMSDIPIIDHGGYVVMGNDPFLLHLLQQNAPQAEINELVNWAVQASGAMAVKVVNPGGIDAFKFHARHLNVNEPHPKFGVTPRRVIEALTQALVDLEIPHPLHVHCSNLGIAGNWKSTMATADAADGRPLHLTHVQFHSYGKQGSKGFSSEAATIAEMVNQHPNLSIDVGQVIFGQTVTVSADIMHQASARRLARPRKWVCSSIESNAGCGVVPFRYRDTNYVHALQWAIGLELLLMVEDPWRIFLTTDHPNGGPFTSYPHLIRLLMDRTFRETQLGRIHPDAAAASQLRGLTREYSLEEIAIITRAAPARILGMQSFGHLGPGAVADLVAYRPDADYEKMFALPEWVYRRGQAVVRQGNILATPTGATHRVQPKGEVTPYPALRDYYQSCLGLRLESVTMPADELAEIANDQVIEHARRPLQSIPERGNDE